MFLFSGGIGGRALVGQSAKKDSVVLMDIDSDGITIQGIDVHDFSVIDALPASIAGRNGTITIW